MVKRQPISQQIIYNYQNKNRNMNYAIETLEKEKALIEKALSDWETKNYPQAKEQREKRLNELNEAIITLVNKEFE